MGPVDRLILVNFLGLIFVCNFSTNASESCELLLDEEDDEDEEEEEEEEEVDVLDFDDDSEEPM